MVPPDCDTWGLKMSNVDIINELLLINKYVKKLVFVKMSVERYTGDNTFPTFLLLSPTL